MVIGKVWIVSNNQYQINFSESLKVGVIHSHGFIQEFLVEGGGESLVGQKKIILIFLCVANNDITCIVFLKDI